MKRGYKIASLIILAIVVGLIIVNLPAKNTTFKEVVLDNLNGVKISSIEIIRSNNTVSDDKVTLTDPSKIESLINVFSQLKLRETSLSNINYKKSYWIIFTANGNREFGMTLYDEDYITLFNYDANKNATKEYNITNKFDLTAIQALFK